MRVLVTGVAGFIGAAVARHLLQRGDEVVGIDNLSDYYDVGLKEDRLRWIEAATTSDFSFKKIDFSKAEALHASLDQETFDAIIHLGAQAGVRYSLENPAAYVQANLVGHCNILELARQREVRHLLYASSSSVYGGNTKLPFSIEDRVDHPLSLYAATKKADELMSEAYAHLYRLPQTGFRFFTVYGPWSRPDMMMWIFTQRILAGEAIPVFNQGNMWRDFTYIDDVVKGVANCLCNPPADDGTIKAGGSKTPHAIFNIGHNKPELLLRVISLLEDACGRKAKLDLLPIQPGDVEQTFADISAIRTEHGFEPATPLEFGVPRFVQWYQEYTGS